MRCRFALVVMALLPVSLCADGPTIVDAGGKEIVLQQWKFASGTRPLSWLDGNPPQALVFRETNSTLFKEGVLTLIPLDRLESLTYDTEKQLVRAKVAGVEQPLEGQTRFAGINQIVIEADVDKGEAGIVELKYRGGPGKGGIKSVKFPGAKAAAELKGERHFAVIADGKKKEAPQAVYNLQALYRLDKDTEKTLPWVMFKKTYKVNLGDVTRMTVQESADQQDFECDVTLKDGSQQTLTLLSSVPVDGKTATLEGLLAEVPAGYRLFPLHTIGEINREQPKSEPAKGDSNQR